MADPNSSFTEAASAAFKSARGKVIDNVFTTVPLLAYLKKAGNVEVRDGGTSITEQIMYDENAMQNLGADPYAILDTAPVKTLTTAEYDWVTGFVPCTISGDEKRKNAGKNQIVSLLDAKITQTKLSLNKSMNTQLYSTTVSGVDSFYGLGGIISATGTVGGIAYSATNSKNETFWLSTVDSSSNAITIAELQAAALTAEMADGPMGGVTNWFTTQAIYLTAASLREDAIRLQDGLTRELGFRHITIDGVPMVPDTQCTSGVCYGVNKNHLKFITHRDLNFDMGEFVKPHDQDAFIAFIGIMGNLVCNNRAKQTKLTSKS